MILDGTNFIGVNVHPEHLLTNFDGTDTSGAYIKNKKIIGEDWKYFDSDDLTYNFNSNGFRHHQELDDVDWDNAIVIYGCSHIQGVGNYVHDTIPYMLQEYFDNYTVVNMGVGGAGVDNVAVNLLASHKKYNPKFNIVCWPQSRRYLSVKIVEHENRIIPTRIVPSTVQKFENFGFNANYIATDDLIFKNSYYKAASTLVPNTHFIDTLDDQFMDIPGVFTAFSKFVNGKHLSSLGKWTQEEMIQHICNGTAVWARDIRKNEQSKESSYIAHWGKDINKCIADWIINQVKDQIQ